MYVEAWLETCRRLADAYAGVRSLCSWLRDAQDQADMTPSSNERIASL